MTELAETHEPSSSPIRRPRKISRGLVVLSVFLLLLGVLILGNWFAGRPTGLGATNGRLANCPDSPNCVCSQETRPAHQIAPLAYEGDQHAEFLRLVTLIKNWPRTKIIEQTDSYMLVEFTTPILRFVDDVEFLLIPDENVIHVRSASRVGHTDMGTNRNRVESLRAAFAAE